MSSSEHIRPTRPGFPRYFKIGRHWANSYKVFLCVGIYSGILLSAAVAEASGISPLRMGVACLLCAVVGLVGARVYYLALSFRRYPKDSFWAEAWNPRRGGYGVFGALLVVPFSFLPAWWVGIPPAGFWDHMIVGIVCGAVWIRSGCIFNGCCCGKVTTGFLGLRHHDVRGVCKRRIPVQWLEIGWWLLAGVGLIWLWPAAFPPATYALGVLCWYGLGRLWLQPLREEPGLVLGRVPVDQLVAGLLAICAGGGLLLLTGRPD